MRNFRVALSRKKAVGFECANVEPFGGELCRRLCNGTAYLWWGGAG
jgi:hypothetical protein